MNIKLITIFALFLMSACDGSQKASYQGYVEGENLYIASPYSGVLLERFIYRGQDVKKGQVLLQLDPYPEADMVKKSEADLLQAKKLLIDLQQPRRPDEIKASEDQIGQVEAQLKLAAIRVSRNTRLVSKGALDKDSLDSSVARYQELEQQKAQYQANLDLAKKGSRENQINAQKAAVEAAVAVLKQSQWQLAQKTLIAPADGLIFDTYYQQGEFVPAQHPIASLLSSKTMRVEFFVPVTIANKLHVGKDVVFSCERCAEENHAMIRYISPEAEYIPPLVYSHENRDKLVFRVKAMIEHPASFKPGEPVMVTVQYDKK